MESHSDRDFVRPPWPQMPPEQFEKVKAKAEHMRTEGSSHITGGTPDEKPLKQWGYNGTLFTKLPADETGVLRVSVGGGYADSNYCVYRGSKDACIELLKEALEGLQAD